MTERAILYAIEFVMLVVAIAALMPTIFRADSARGRESAGKAQEADSRIELEEALRSEKARLDDELARGLVTQAIYEQLLSDLRSRTLEELRALQSKENVSPDAEPVTKQMRIRLAVGVTSMMVLLSALCYGFLGAPEVMRLTEDQKVLQGTASAEAIETYLGDNEKDGRAWVLLAHRRIEGGDFKGAAAAYREAFRVEKKIAADPDILLEYGAAVLTANDAEFLDDAKAALLKAQTMQPENPKAIELVGMAAFATKDWVLAKHQLEIMLSRMTPDRPEYMRFEETIKVLDERIRADREALDRAAREAQKQAAEEASEKTQEKQLEKKPAPQ